MVPRLPVPASANNGACTGRYPVCRGAMLCRLRDGEQGMTKHIGIVGCSAEGAALCYRTICAEAEAYMGKHCHPELSTHTFALGDYMEHIVVDDWNAVGALMARSANKLQSIGADIMICPDNTIHQAFATAVQHSTAPWLHIAEAVAEEAARLGYSRLGITGTAYLMSGPVYPEALAKHGIEYVLPSDEDRETINRCIFDELVKGIYTDDARAFFSAVFARAGAAGCDAVVMGCTEIPILMDGVETALPTLDSTRTLARAAIAAAVA